MRINRVCEIVGDETIRIEKNPNNTNNMMVSSTTEGVLELHMVLDEEEFASLVFAVTNLMEWDLDRSKMYRDLIGKEN